MIKVKNDLQITPSLVTNLIAQQFPQCADLPIRQVEPGGHDNRTFRLGHNMLVRLPSAQEYAAKVQIEQKWLPFLAKYLSFQIPKPLAMGIPSQDYPWHWSVYEWIEGESASSRDFNEIQLQQFAIQLAQFLNELHKIDSTGAPPPGAHNFYRGDSPIVYDAETQVALDQLKDCIDAEAAKAVWQKALNSTWTKKPVWIHGDLSSDNVLVKNKRLVAIIDFGGMAVGDPACDLVIAWTFLDKQSRKVFNTQLDLDFATWARARGWALWKALVTLASLKDKYSLEAKKLLYIINEILNEHENYNEKETQKLSK